MRIKRLSLENFKCFRHLEMDFGKITLLTGANSSGKSSVIAAILGMMQTDGFPFYFSPNGKYINMGSFTDLSWNHENENIITFNLIITNDLCQKKQVNSSWKKGNNNIPISTNLSESRTMDGIHSILENIDFQKFTYISSHRRPTERFTFQESMMQYHINIYGENYDLQIFDWKYNNPQQFQAFIHQIKKIGLVEKINTKRKSGGSFELLVKNKTKSTYQNLYDVGTGVSHFLPIIVADLQLPQNSTLIVSDPELHLHPDIQANFGTYMVNQANQNNKNYLIETHSEYLLNRLRLEIVKGNIAPEDVKVYYLQNNGIESEYFDIQLLKNGQVQGAPQAFFDTYMKDNMEIALNSFA